MLASITEDMTVTVFKFTPQILEFQHLPPNAWSPNAFICSGTKYRGVAPPCGQLVMLQSPHLPLHEAKSARIKVPTT